MAYAQEALAGRYALLEVLGRGGMGVVYRASDRTLDRDVAVKVLLLAHGEDATVVARFEREARAAAALGHPNIVSVYDSGRDGDTHFIVMEYLPGPSLAHVLREHGPLAPAEAMVTCGQVARALTAAHRAGIIHRDIKPANVMLDGARTVKVLDFGIARTPASTTLTHAMAVVGSAPYIAPELLAGHRADERSDIYALGCTLYETLTGRPPFVGELDAAVLQQHGAVEPAPPRELNAEIPPSLEALVLEMLSKDPARRPQTAELVAEALEETPRPPGAVAHSRRPRTATTRLVDDRARVRRRRRTALRVASVALILAVLVAIALGLSAPGTSPHAPKKPAARRSPPTSGAATRRAKSGGAASGSAQSAATSTTSTTSTGSARSGAPSQPRATDTVGAAAGAFTTLVTQDLQSGMLQQHAAQQLISGLQGVLNAYYSGGVEPALNQAATLVTQSQQLASHSEIAAAALPSIDSHINALLSALERAPSTDGGTAPAPTGGPSASNPAGQAQPPQAGAP